MAVMSGKVYSDTGVPSNTYGADGDIYMRLDGLKTTYRKEGGIWTPIGSQVGAIPEFLKGNDAPDNALGEDNQYYREVSTGKVYEKQSGVWAEVGAWTSLEVQTLLQESGLGVDLGSSNYILNIDAFTTAGGEGYFGTSTAGTKPTTGFGLCRAWRVDASKVYQEAHTSDNKWLTRLTTDGGATWTAWRAAASDRGDASLTFKASAGVDSDDVAVVGQLAGIPSGAALIWPLSTPPTGFLELAGQSTTGYPNLVTIYGATLPDMRGVFPRGWDNGRGIDSGRGLLTTQAATRISPQILGHTFIDIYNEDSTENSGTVASSGAGTGGDLSRTYKTFRPINMAWMWIVKI